MGSASIFVYLKKGDLGDKTILTDSRASAGDLRQSSTGLSRLAVSWLVGQLVGRFSPGRGSVLQGSAVEDSGVS